MASFAGPCWDGKDGTEHYPQYHRRLLPPSSSSCETKNSNDDDDHLVAAVDVVIPPGVQEQPHTHCRPSFMVVDSPAAVAVVLVDKNGTSKEVFRRDKRQQQDPNDDEKEEVHEPVNVQKMDPEPLHFVCNLETDRYLRATRFEFFGKPVTDDDDSPSAVAAEEGANKNVAVGGQVMETVKASAKKLLHTWHTSKCSATIWSVVSATGDDETALDFFLSQQQQDGKSGNDNIHSVYIIEGSVAEARRKRMKVAVHHTTTPSGQEQQKQQQDEHNSVLIEPLVIDPSVLTEVDRENNNNSATSKTNPRPRVWRILPSQYDTAPMIRISNPEATTRLHNDRTAEDDVKFFVLFVRDDERRRRGSGNEAVRIVAQSQYLSLSTCGSGGGEGEPWCAPLSFWCGRKNVAGSCGDDHINDDESLRFYFVSPKNARHVEDIKENPKTAVAIFDSSVPFMTGSGLQFSCRAKVLDGDDDERRRDAAIRAISVRFPAEDVEACFQRHKEMFSKIDYCVVELQPREIFMSGRDHRREVSLGADDVLKELMPFSQQKK